MAQLATALPERHAVLNTDPGGTPVRLIYALLADHAQFDGDGKLHVCGGFDAMRTVRFPAHCSPHCLVFRIDGITPAALGNRELFVELVDEDGGVIGSRVGPVALTFRKLREDGEAYFAVSVCRIEGLRLPKPGVYEYHLWLGEIHLGEAPFILANVAPPN